MITELAKSGLQKGNRLLSKLDRKFDVESDKALPPPLFILGVPRSGTTLTYQLITQQFKVGYFTSLMGYSYGLSNILSYTLRSILGRPLSVFKSNYGHTSGILSPSEHAGFWLQWLPQGGTDGHYLNPEKTDLSSYFEFKQRLESILTIMHNPMVFKCLYLDMNVGLLAKLFPYACFILVTRDPVMVCQSMLRGRLSRRNPEHWWSVKIPGYKKLLNLPLWQQVTEQVFYIESALRKDLNEYAQERFREVNYETLCSQPKHVISDLEKWLTPFGYNTYRDWRAPTQFTTSSKITISMDTLNKMRKHLAYLQTTNS